MEIQLDYGKELKKLEKEKEEWEKYKKEQESRLNQEKEILMDLQNTINNEKIHNSNKIQINKNDIIEELEKEKSEYENKIKDIESQINSIEEDRELFNDYKNECEGLLNLQLEEITNKKLELIKRKKIVDEEYDNVKKREINYLFNFEKLEKRKKIINDLLYEIKQKEIENKQRAKNIIEETNNFDLRKNEIETNKKIYVEKLNEIKLEKEKISREKKIVENKKNDLLLKLESVNLVGMKLSENKFPKENGKND